MFNGTWTASTMGLIYLLIILVVAGSSLATLLLLGVFVVRNTRGDIKDPASIGKG